MKLKLLFTFLLLILLQTIGFGQKTWDGSSSANWNTANNWTPSGVPAATDNVVIPNGVPNMPTISSAAAVCNNLTINASATLTVANQNFTVSGTSSISGTLIHSSTTGTKIFTGLVTVNSGGTWSNTANATIGFTGGITNNGTFTAGTGVQTFSTNAQELLGNLTIARVTVTDFTLTNKGNLYVSTALSGTGEIINASPAANTLVIQGTSSIAAITNNGTAIIENAGAISTATFTNTGTLHLNGSGTIASITNSTGGIINLNSSGTIASFNNATGTSVLNINALTVPTITTFTVNTAGNTVNYSGAGPQIVRTAPYSNLTLSGSGAKTFAATTAISRNLSISGTATATFNATGNTAATLTLGGSLQNSGTYGGTNSVATNIITAYFNAPGAPQANKYVTVSCTALTAPSAVSSSPRCGVGTVSLSATPGSGQTIDWYAASSGGTALLTGNSSYTTPSIAGTTTYYAEARNTTTGCVSATRTAVTATVNAVPIVTVDKLTSNICSGQSVTLTAAGDPGNALTMGTNNYLQVSNPNPLGTTTDFTFETMLYWTNNTTNWQRIFDFGLNTDENMFFTPRYDGTIMPRYAITTTGFCDTCEQRINGTTSIPTNSWHHLAITYNAATSTGIMYLDGVQIGINSAMTITPADITKTFSYFGKSQYPDPYLAGTMDEIRLWNVARTAAEINEYKGSTVPLSSTGLVAYYKLNEGTGTSSSSAVGSSSVALSGSPTWTTSTAPVSSSDGLTPTYSWTPPTGLNTPSGAVVIASPTTTTTYTVTSTYPNSCTATATAVVNVTAAPTAVAAGPDTACQSATPSAITLSGSSVGGSATTGAWSITSGGGSLSSTAQTSSPGTVTYTPAANFTGTVSLLLTSNAGTGCTAVTSSRTITVNALPTVTSTAPGSKIYTGAANATTVSAVVSAGATIDWYANAAGGTALSTGSLTYAPTGINVGTYTVYAQARNTTTGCISTSRTAAVLTITQLPVILAGTRPYDGTTNALSTNLTISNNADGGNLTLSGTGILAAKDVGTRAISAPATPARIQNPTGSTGTAAATSFTVTVAAPANGNTLVAVISTKGTTVTGSVTSIIQAGATWTLATKGVNGNNGTTTEIWYAPNVSGAGTTVTINQASLRSAAVVMEYSGILTASPLDQTNNNTGNSNAATTGTTSTTTQANELLIGGIGLVNSSYTLTALTGGFTAVANAASTNGTPGNNAEVYALERIVSATGTYSTGGTISTSSRWSGAIATFKAVVPSGTALTLGGSAAGNYTLTGLSGSMIITPKVLSVTAPTIASKVYDGSAVSGAITAGTLSGFVGTETVTATATGLYADANAGTGKTATITYTLANGTNGGLAANYSLSGTGTGNITPASLTVTGAAVTSKTYDGTTAATITGASLSGVLAADAGNVTLANATTGTFNNANIGVGKAVATAPMTISGTASLNYTLTQPTLTGTITGATPTVTVTPVGTYTYNGSANGPTAASNTGTGTSYTFSYAGTAYDATTYSASATRPTKAGTYTVTATVAANGNYTSGSSIATAFTIDRATITVTGAAVTSKTYDGTTAATITGASLSGVLAADVANVTLGNATTGTFNNANIGVGKAVATAPMTISGTASSNYTLTQPTLTGTITGATPTVTVTPVGTYTYNGSANGPTAATNTGTGTSYTFSYAGIAYDATTYSASATRPTKAGTYTVTATVAANGNYTSGSSSATAFTIDRATITVTGAAVTSKTYDGTTTATITGAVLSGVLVADAGNVTLGNATTGTFNNANIGVGKAVATAPMTISGTASSNYTLTQPTLTGTITGATPTVTPTVGTYTYNGAANGPTAATNTGTGTSYTFSYAGTAYDTTTYSASATRPTKAGTYTVTVTVAANGNYTSGSSIATAFTIDRATITVTGAAVTSKTFDGTTTATITGAVLSGVLVADASNVSLGNATTGTFNNANIGVGKAVATAPMTISGTASSNYTLTQPTLTGTITGATPTVTPTVGTYTYNGAANGPTVATNTGTGTSYTFSYAGTAYDTTTYSASATRPTKAGTYTVTVTVAANGNYTSGSSSATAFTIDRATITVTGAAVTSKTYDGTTVATITGAVLSGVLVADASNVSLGNATTGTFNNANAGTGKAVATAPMTISGLASSNYTLTQPTLTGTITGATLTITANAQNKCYGTVLALGTTAFTTSSLQNGETITSVTLTSTGGYDASLTQSANTYAGNIIPSNPTGAGFSAGNYAITMVNGDLTIYAIPTVSNAGADQSGSNSSFTLAANTPAVGTGMWSIVSGSSALLSQFSSTVDPIAVFTPAVTGGSYVLRWTISNGSCTASTDDVVISNCTNNLISNGDFTNSATGNNNAVNWTYVGTTSGSYVETYPEDTYFATGNTIGYTAELDSESSIMQTVTVVPGVSYTVSFIYAQRPGAPTPTAVNVKITDGAATINSPTFSSSVRTPTVGTFDFTPTSSSIGIEFYNSLNGGLTYGTIIDNIVLIPSSQVAPIAVAAGGTFNTATACAGATVQLDVRNVPASGVTYLWTGSPGSAISSAVIKNPTITFTGSGMQQATVTVTTAGGCSISSTTYVNVSTPTATAGAALAAICQGAASAAMGGSVGGSATGGTWSGGAGSWTNANNPSTATYTAGASESGSITLTLTTSGGSCGTTTATKTLTVNPLPNNVSSGFSATTICAGGSPQLIFDADNGATFTTPYSITYRNDATLAQFTIAIPNASPFSFTPGDNPTANAGYTLVSISNATCTNSTVASFGDSGANLIVRPIPTATISGTTSVCAGSSSPNITFTNPQTVAITVTYTINNGANQTINVGVGASNTSSIAVSTAAGGSFVYDLVNVVYQDTPNCSNAITGQSAAVTVNAPPAITAQPSSHSVCETGDTSFIVDASGSGLTYQWQLSTDGGGNFSNLSNAGVYTNVTTAEMNITAATIAMNSYQYRCVVSGTCPSPVTSSAATLSVTTDSGSISLNGGTPIATSSIVFYCPSTTASFSIDLVSGATGYNWFVPAGWTNLSGNGTNKITVTTGGTVAESGNVYVVATNASGNMFCTSYIWVTLDQIAPPPLTISKTDPICAVPTGTVKAAPLSPPVIGTLTYTLIKTNVIPEVVIGTNGLGEFTGLAGGDYVMTYQINSGCHSDRSNSVTIVPLSTNTWNGPVLGWSKGIAPSLNDYVVFNADYSEPITVNSCSCVINSGADVTIGDAIGTALVLNIVNGLDVQGTLTFMNNASLVQLDDNAVNHGIITYNRTTPFLKDLDYEYWSSPVAGQTLGGLWASDRYFRYTNGAWEAQGSGTTMDIGRGYIIRVRTAAPFEQSVVFQGAPNNGVKTILTQGANKSNLIGNPYPSALDGEAFMSNNDAVGGALYFWTHYTARQLVGNKFVYDADDYAVFNLTGGGSTAPSNGAGVAPTGKIASGQAFFVVSDKAGSFTFDNSMRFDIDNGNVMDNSQFFRPSGTKKAAKIERNRVWLNLTNEGGAFKQLLVGYVTGASNDFDKLYDGVTRNGNAFVDFYSINNSKNYTIQGRGLPFDKTDEVPLGYKTTIAGTFQIGIDKADGGMVNQTVYLEDKLTNTIHDLKAGSYSFATEIGAFNDRFVLRYTNTTKLGTGDAEVKGKGVFVSVRNREIKINSFDQTMSSLKVYDLKGSLLYTKDKVDKNEFIIDTLNTANQFMIVMVQLEDGKWISEEIIFHD